MTRVLMIGVLALWLSASGVPLPAMAVDAPLATSLPPTSLATQFARQIIDRMAAVSAGLYVEERLKAALDADPHSARLLPNGSPARAVFLKEAVTRTESNAAAQIRPLIPAFVSALDANMTPAQIKAAAHLFATPTGKRILDRMVSKEILSQGEDSAEMTDAEVQSLINVADVPALIAVEKSGAIEAMSKAMEALPENEDDLLTKMQSDVDEMLRQMLAKVKALSQATTIDTSAHPAL